MKIEIEHAGAIDFLRTLPDASVDALVTDPPSGTAFMGSIWDNHTSYEPQTNIGKDAVRFLSALSLEAWEVGFVAFISDVMWECWRVLKPGAHGLVWALPRTSDLTAMGLRLARFQIRDSVHHMFGSGFPKSLDISKAIDKAAGAEREVVASSPFAALRGGSRVSEYGFGDGSSSDITAPATPEAKQWQGWGTALKPGHEVWWLIRKPFIGTVAKNVMTYGTGGLNIDACRVGSTTRTNASKPNSWRNGSYSSLWRRESKGFVGGTETTTHNHGRWPPNVLLSHAVGCRQVGTRAVKGDARNGGGVRPAGFADVGSTSGNGVPVAAGHADPDGNERVDVYECVQGCPVGELGEQSGDVTSGVMTGMQRGWGKRGIFGPSGDAPAICYDDNGTAARFFPQFRYVAKASRAEREAGLESLDQGDDAVLNTHPTVKSLALMKWLVQLISPKGGLVLDPFTGSGTTAVACAHLNMRFVGSEMDEKYVEIARMRVAHADPSIEVAYKAAGKIKESPTVGQLKLW